MLIRYILASSVMDTDMEIRKIESIVEVAKSRNHRFVRII